MARYTCTGSCKGSVSKEEYKAGKTTCQAENRERKGQPLVRQD